jgi:hypothetical protein
MIRDPYGRSTPNNKHSNKPRGRKYFRVNLAVADIAFLSVAAVALNAETKETIFACIRCFIIYPIRPYSWPFGATRGDV